MEFCFCCFSAEEREMIKPSPCTYPPPGGSLERQKQEEDEAFSEEESGCDEDVNKKARFLRQDTKLKHLKQSGKGWSNMDLLKALHFWVSVSADAEQPFINGKPSTYLAFLQGQTAAIRDNIDCIQSMIALHLAQIAKDTNYRYQASLDNSQPTLRFYKKELEVPHSDRRLVVDAQ